MRAERRSVKAKAAPTPSPQTLTCTDGMAPEAFGADGEKHLADRTERAPLFYEERRHFPLLCYLEAAGGEGRRSPKMTSNIINQGKKIKQKQSNCCSLLVLCAGPLPIIHFCYQLCSFSYS